MQKILGSISGDFWWGVQTRSNPPQRIHATIEPRVRLPASVSAPFHSQTIKIPPESLPNDYLAYHPIAPYIYPQHTPPSFIMPPDLNSLPPSPSPNLTPQSTHSTRSRMANNHDVQNSPPALSPQTTSLAAAAALNAGLQNEERHPSSGRLARSFERRRSSVRMNLSLNDPTLPAPGEMAMSPGSRTHASNWSQSSSSPTRHTRQPSLGELHQELESEQEAQVVCTAQQKPERLETNRYVESPSIHDTPATIPDTTSPISNPRFCPQLDRHRGQ
jgi:hypothetical protein